MPESSITHPTLVPPENSSAAKPLVSIVTVNYKQTRMTELMLESLGKISYPAVEIFVVDNGSEDESILRIREQYPDVHLIMSPKNLGFAGGNNLAFPHCKGEYILMLNNDTEVDPGFIEPIVRMLEENPNVGIVSPKIFFFDEPHLLQFAGASDMSPVTLRGRKFGYRSEDNGSFDEPREIGFPNGACMMFRRSVMEKIGYMYEPFFLYYEEHDWVEHAKRAGYKVMFQPESRIWHKVSASTGADSPLKAHYIHRNRLVFIRRNRFGITGLLARLYFWMVVTPKTLWKYRASKAHRQAIFRSIRWHLSHSRLPEQPAVQQLTPVSL